MAGLLLSGCGSSTSTTPGRDAGLDGGPIDGTTVDTGDLDGGSPADGAGMVVCTGPLQDAGFSTLAELPIASMCAASASISGYGSGSVTKGTEACQGTIIVHEQEGVDCEGFWLFSAATGALLATGGGCDIVLGCSGAVAGLQFPIQCFDNGGWFPYVELCPDGGAVEGGIADASVDSPD